MAGGSLLTLLDDIASVLDDVALMTKAATKKTAGVLGDDIALNAQQVTGVVSNRELPVVWAVAKGSFVNKLILVPAALAISAFIPAAITPLLMVGGLYLCYEGVEKVVHSLFRPNDVAHLDVPPKLSTAAGAVAAPVAGAEASDVPTSPTPEQVKIQAAIRTDFILSAEIIAITLGTVAAVSFVSQAIVVSTVAIIMTVGVYGLVAGIVKLDDGGLYLSQRRGDGFIPRVSRRLGSAILTMAPWLMKSLSIVGTIAMFLVGGSILMHGIAGAEALVHDYVHIDAAGSPGLWNVALNLIGPSLASAILGIVAGAITLLVVAGVKRVIR
ncbi:DUF808 domain-containing protein [Candidimonas sp. SYP-B2681]|uniref:DUF808 domain-containing protein n=1 Tax=Candidimonas sp. SYP-B2681 TaxID=2497686 RepID=UPI000F893C31|nr:DUF808 domain-containing protein [Candidimonas sp. SYP-B2681]RTZ39218.1 DUF808 domain-containing protein [Candidimonas sp. SYP-B2681]